MWGTNEPFPFSASPFHVSITPPAVDPDGGSDLVSVTLAREWLPAVLGACSALTLQSTWRGDAAAVETAILRAQLLLEILSKAAQTMQVPEYLHLARNLGIGQTDGNTVSLTPFDIVFNNVYDVLPDWWTESVPDDDVRLAPGVYDFYASWQAFQAQGYRIQIWNQTVGVLALEGVTPWHGAGHVMGRVVIAQSTSFRLRITPWVAVTNGKGYAFMGTPAKVADLWVIRWGDVPA